MEDRWTDTAIKDLLECVVAYGQLLSPTKKFPLGQVKPGCWVDIRKAMLARDSAYNQFSLDAMSTKWSRIRKGKLEPALDEVEFKGSISLNDKILHLAGIRQVPGLTPFHRLISQPIAPRPAPVAQAAAVVFSGPASGYHAQTPASGVTPGGAGHHAGAPATGFAPHHAGYHAGAPATSFAPHHAGHYAGAPATSFAPHHAGHHAGAPATGFTPHHAGHHAGAPATRLASHHARRRARAPATGSAPHLAGHRAGAPATGFTSHAAGWQTQKHSNFLPDGHIASDSGPRAMYPGMPGPLLDPALKPTHNDQGEDLLEDSPSTRISLPAFRPSDLRARDRLVSTFPNMSSAEITSLLKKSAINIAAIWKSRLALGLEADDDDLMKMILDAAKTAPAPGENSAN